MTACPCQKLDRPQGRGYSRGVKGSRVYLLDAFKALNWKVTETEIKILSFVQKEPQPEDKVQLEFEPPTVARRLALNLLCQFYSFEALPSKLFAILQDQGHATARLKQWE